MVEGGGGASWRGGGLQCVQAKHRKDIPDSKVHGTNMGPSGADRTQMGPMLAPWTLLSGTLISALVMNTYWKYYPYLCWERYCLRFSFIVPFPRFKIGRRYGKVHDILCRSLGTEDYSNCREGLVGSRQYISMTLEIKMVVQVKWISIIGEMIMCFVSRFLENSYWVFDMSVSNAVMYNS